MLCKRLSKDDASDLFVAFISNHLKQVPLWHQRASKRVDGLTIWDYHVICIQRNRESKVPFQVWDLDSTLPFPSPLSHYVTEAIRPSFQLYPQYQRLFRVVHGPLFISNFASDRSHMKDSTGNWIHQPPAYEPIVAEDGTVHNLDKYMKIHAAEATSFNDDLVRNVLSEKYGVVVGEGQFMNLFSLLPDNKNLS